MSSTPTSTQVESDHQLLARLQPATHEFVKAHMASWDSSHDFEHVKRVVYLAQHLARTSQTPIRMAVVILAAYLHDVEDSKYLKSNIETQDPTTHEKKEPLAKRHLLSLDAPEEFAEAVSIVANNVSYSKEVKNPTAVRSLVERYPELAYVQDADRIDAIGAVGVARCFVYGATQRALSADFSRDVAESTLDMAMRHYSEKLEWLEDWIKSPKGKEIARERTQRLKQFKTWFLEETSIAHEATFCQ